jgi:acid stress chaperone HdeB
MRKDSKRVAAGLCMRSMLWGRMILGALAIPLMSVGPASAQIIDMRTVTCSDFIGFKRDTLFAIAMWLDAYYRDEDDPPIIDFEQLKKKTARPYRLLQPEPYTFLEHRGGADHDGAMKYLFLYTMLLPPEYLSQNLTARCRPKTAARCAPLARRARTEGQR